MQGLSFPSKAAYQTKQEYVYEVLRDMIMKCDLIPGEKLVISHIASQLHVSTIPVREALKLLHSEGLVNYNHHIGAVVAPITKASIVETFTIKEGLEGVATRVAVGKATENDLCHLEEQLTEMDEVIKNERYEKWGPLNAQFHSSMVQIAEMPVLKEMHLKVLDQWDRIQRYFFHEVWVYRHIQSQKEHYEILKGMKENDLQEAEQRTREHNRKALQDYMEYLDEKQK